MKKLLLTLMLVVMCGSFARADSPESLPPALKIYQPVITAIEKGNIPQAIELLRPLAIQGDEKAQGWLGLIYEKGEDHKEAVKWYRKAADQGDTQSQYNLGLMYKNGEGVPQDYVLAHMWLNLAASNGSKRAKDYREWIAKKMTPAQISQAQKMARNCEKKVYKSCE